MEALKKNIWRVSVFVSWESCKIVDIVTNGKNSAPEKPFFPFLPLKGA